MFLLLNTLSPYMWQNLLTPLPTPEPESITADSTSTKTATVPDQLWDKSKVVTLQLIGAILNDFGLQDYSSALVCQRVGDIHHSYPQCVPSQ